MGCYINFSNIAVIDGKGEIKYKGVGASEAAL